MNTEATRTLARPRHLLDLPGIAVWTLAAVGTTALALANAIDTAAARRRTPALGHTNDPPEPGRRTHVEYGVPDSWRIR